MTSTREQGDYTENLARQFLESKGFKLIEKNFNCRMGEIDLIMQDSASLVFVEVRYRRNTHFGSGAESVTPNKQAKLLKTAALYLQKNSKLNQYPTRFDVISMTGSLATNDINKINFDWIKNAFGA